MFRWVLRDLYLSDPEATVKFITDNYEFFSREGLRYALEKMPIILRNKLMKWKEGDPVPNHLGEEENVVPKKKKKETPTKRKRGEEPKSRNVRSRK